MRYTVAWCAPVWEQISLWAWSKSTIVFLRASIVSRWQVKNKWIKQKRLSDVRFQSSDFIDQFRKCLLGPVLCDWKKLHFICRTLYTFVSRKFKEILVKTHRLRQSLWGSKPSPQNSLSFELAWVFWNPLVLVLLGYKTIFLFALWYDDDDTLLAT